MTCNHTIHLKSDSGKIQGSWKVDPHGFDRHRVTCRYCGRFYGYLFPEVVSQKKQKKQEPNLLS